MGTNPIAPVPRPILGGTGVGGSPCAGALPPREGALGFIGDTFVGGAAAIADMGRGLATLVAHPMVTAAGLSYSVMHPASTLQSIIEPYAQAVAEGKPGLAVGRALVEAGTCFIGCFGFAAKEADVASGASIVGTGAARAAASSAPVDVA
ncbi:MAG: hypothetical protein KGR26_16060, partial [Cyanobacteria bacterium REEB65]|nr:hypothetical protein [Cyanobacteria bacterium REEB65]